MEKKREQELSVLEVLRLHREFHLPRPVPADEQEKPLDKVKEPPRACRSRNSRKTSIVTALRAVPPTSRRAVSRNESADDASSMINGTMLYLRHSLNMISRPTRLLPS